MAIRSLLLFLFVFNVSIIDAQKVGVVLSGGGASGMAHIGVLKALEDSSIPVDYIAGSSQGALIGAMYAAGYSPAEIAVIVSSPTFNDLSKGVIQKEDAYYFKRDHSSASWVSLKMSLDSTLNLSLPTNLIPPTALDFGLMEFLEGAGAASAYNFDSLFVPFRCLASDIEHKESIVFSKGDLSQAVRASIAYPFYIPPITVDGKLLFDGGLYNNFPSDVMYDDFYPDIIIGSNVSENESPREGDLLSQVKSMLQYTTNYDVLCENGVLIEPQIDVATFDFSNPQPIIDKGYASAMLKMDEIKGAVERRVSSEELKKKRISFADKQPEVQVDSIYIEGLSPKQTIYARKIFRKKKGLLNLEDVRASYFRLASDDKLKSVYPLLKYNVETGLYDLYLDIRKEKKVVVDFGGNFSNSPISVGYIGLRYNYLSRFSSSVLANAYIGKLYSSVQLKGRFDFPASKAFYLEPRFTWNRWDYYKSSALFFEGSTPPFLKNEDMYGGLELGVAVGNKARLVSGLGSVSTKSFYYQKKFFSSRDIPDETDFNALSANLYIDANSLNKKQYASRGERFFMGLKYVSGNESTVPGTTSQDSLGNLMKKHDWLRFKITAERYFNRRGLFRIGLFGEGVYSTQSSFQNYTSTALAAPAFFPTPHSQTVFIPNHRAYSYLATGVRFITALREQLEWRVETYVFQPYQSLRETDNNKVELSKPFEFRHVIASSTLVWSTPVGPIGASINYYSLEEEPVSLLFHFGYILFNKSVQN